MLVATWNESFPFSIGNVSELEVSSTVSNSIGHIICDQL